ncbi:MAG: shikimate kinase [Pseudomonadales bacterium]|nr:shikimate kinase [Pseudomonadales bacterium]
MSPPRGNNSPFSQLTQANIILIGMPGAGKSTVGELLASAINWAFLDSDRLIEKSEGSSLQELVDTHSYTYLRDIEQGILSTIGGQQQVIATGGSAVYSQQAIQHLHTMGPVIYLEISEATMLKRLQGQVGKNRGLAKPRDQSLHELYTERQALYRSAAHIAVCCDNKDASEVCKEIYHLLATTTY